MLTLMIKNEFHNLANRFLSKNAINITTPLPQGFPTGAVLFYRGYDFAWVGSMRDWQSSDVRPITRFEKIDIQANIQALI